LGRSGAERDRAGFQQMVAEVSLGKAGIVMGLEVSRLARNSVSVWATTGLTLTFQVVHF